MTTPTPGGLPALAVDLREKWFAAVGDAPAKRVLGALSFRVEPGEVVALIGPSGCGKTTLLNLIAGLDHDFDGRIELGPHRRLAYVFQEPRLLPWRTVEDNVRLVLEDLPGAEDRVRAMLSRVGLASARALFASRLSLGMARRVSLARAFVIEPGLLLLDEPFVSLDAQTAGRLRRLLLDLLALHRSTAILVTHDLREAVMLAQRLLVLSPGPGQLLAEVDVPLSEAERLDERAIDVYRANLLARPELADLSAVGIEPPPPASLGGASS
ncbi:MAG: ATP-binding cassette domain-containing protein [Pseudomonadota bacterium]